MRIIIVGAGGHAKVILSMLHALGLNVIGLFDDNASLKNHTMLGNPILGTISEVNKFTHDAAICAIGDNTIRKLMVEKLNLNWTSVIHPRAIVDASVKIGKGTVIFAGAIIQADAIIGDHVIVNTAATIDHDCQIDHFVHVAPGCHLGGGVHLNCGGFLGIGSVVKPYVSVGQWSSLGAGSVVVKNIQPFAKAKGVPAKVYGETQTASLQQTIQTA